MVTSTTTHSPYGTVCIECGGLLIAPDRSQHVTSLEVRHVWSCEGCGVQFETSDHLRADTSSDTRRKIRPLPLLVA